MNDKTDQRALLAITLSLVVFTAWSFFFGPKTPPEGELPVADEAAAEVAGSATGAAPIDAAPAVEAAADEGPCVPEPLPLSTSVADLRIDNCGRGVSEVRLADREAPIPVLPWWSWVWGRVTGSIDGGWIPYGESAGQLHLVGPDGVFGAAGLGDAPVVGGTWSLSQYGGGALVRRVGADEVLITTSIRPTEAPDLFDVTYRWESASPMTTPLWIGVGDTLSDSNSAYDTHVKLAAVVDGDLETLEKPSDVEAPDPLEGPVSWFGLTDRYFLAALLPTDPAWGQLQWRPMGEGRTGAFLMHPAVSLTPGAPVEATFRAYIGPKDAERLDAVGGDLDEAAALGWFGFFGKIFLFLLHVFQKGLVNWGLSIMALTCLVRLALWPVMRGMFLNGKKMQLLAPKLKELQEQFGDDREGLGKATFALYAEHKVNPVAGCLPAVLQIPIFLGLFNGLRSTPDLFHSHFLYVQDLSMPDPYGVLPGVMTLGMVLQQRMTPMTGMDPTQQQIMRLMPFMFAAFMFTMPAGLQVYYVINTGLALFQQWYNTRSWELAQPSA